MASEFATASLMNSDVRDVNNFQFEPPRAFAYRNTDFSTTTSVETVVSMANELYDPYATPAHDTATNPSRMIAAEHGIYQVICAAAWAPDATGARHLKLRKNAAGSPSGGTQVAIQTVASVGGSLSTRLNVIVEVSLTAGDYVEMFTLQNSGGNLNVIGGQSETFMSIRWVAKQ